MGDDDHKSAKKERKEKLKELNETMDRLKDLIEKGKWDDTKKQLGRLGS
jgi:hypothetical protein